MSKSVSTKNHKKIFFASDFHLGISDQTSSLEREKKIVRWLDSIEEEAGAIFLMGDLFDFWFEYRRVIPKGFIRLLGKLAFLADKGVKLYIFTGNHDLFMFSYLNEQLDISIHHNAKILNLMGKNFYLAHGYDLRPGIIGSKFVKGIFENSICRWFFSWFHPDLGVGLASFLSNKSRGLKFLYGDPFLSEYKERMIKHAEQLLKIHKEIDYFVFAHLHLPLYCPLNDNIYCINLGDWLTHFSYAVFDGLKLELKFFCEDSGD